MPSTYAFYICHLADGKAPESIYHYICGQNPCQVEAENSAPYIWHLGQSHKVHVMLGLRVLANPDDSMEMSGILGHNPLRETEPVLGEDRWTISHSGWRITTDGIGEAERSKPGAASEDNYWPSAEPEPRP